MTTNHTIKALFVVHENLYSATFDKEDIISVHEDDTVIRVSLKKDYKYEDSGFLRWDSFAPFDKDEITSMTLEFQNGETKHIRVPFNDISSNGSYCDNERSTLYEEESSITIEWKK